MNSNVIEYYLIYWNGLTYVSSHLASGRFVVCSEKQPNSVWDAPTRLSDSKAATSFFVFWFVWQMIDGLALLYVDDINA